MSGRVPAATSACTWRWRSHASRYGTTPACTICSAPGPALRSAVIREAYVGGPDGSVRTSAAGVVTLGAVNDLRVALIGYGMAGREFHAPLLRGVAGARITHVVTGDADRAAAARAENPGVTVVPEPDALWQLAGRLDVVVVASPSGAHAAQAREAVRRDLAVVVDKPLAVSAADARDLVETWLGNAARASLVGR